MYPVVLQYRNALYKELFFLFDTNLMVISLHPLNLVALLSFYAHLCLFAE